MLPTDVEHHGTQWRDKNSPSTEGEPQGERRETLLRWQASRLPIVNGWTTRHTALERYTYFVIHLNLNIDCQLRYASLTWHSSPVTLRNDTKLEPVTSEI